MKIKALKRIFPQEKMFPLSHKALPVPEDAGWQGVKKPFRACTCDFPLYFYACRGTKAQNFDIIRNMKSAAVVNCDFENLIKGGYVYVNKMDRLCQLTGVRFSVKENNIDDPMIKVFRC